MEIERAKHKNLFSLFQPRCNLNRKRRKEKSRDLKEEGILSLSFCFNSERMICNVCEVEPRVRGFSLSTREWEGKRKWDLKYRWSGGAITAMQRDETEIEEDDEAERKA